MKPIRFACVRTLNLTGPEIAHQILDLDLWCSFQGYGPLPGIQSATFDRRTDDVVGTRIRVTETGGTTHIEEIVVWQPESRVQLDMYEFTPPLSHLATRFEEVGTFTPAAHGTLVTRSFTLWPKRSHWRPVLWLISLLLRRSIDRHLEQMDDAVRSSTPPEVAA